MPRNSPRDGSSLLIASVSARALAEAARRAGFTPLVADFFADADTQDAAHACRKLTGLARGFRWRSLYPALCALAELAPSPVLGLVYGSGFEDRPELLRLISRRWPLLGTGASAVARLKSPEDFFATLDRLGIAHPPTQSEPPARGGKWLAKKRGGAGGSHIVPSRHARAKADAYFQEQRRGARRVGAVRRMRRRGSRARLQRAVDFTASRAPLALWRSGVSGKPLVFARAKHDRDRQETRARLSDQRACLRRLSPLRRRASPARDQSASGRHARYLRSRQAASAFPPYRSGAGRQIAVARARAPRRHGLGNRLCRASRAGPRGRRLARLGRRPAAAIGMDRQEPPDMHCVGARRNSRRSETFGRSTKS